MQHSAWHAQLMPSQPTSSTGFDMHGAQLASAVRGLLMGASKRTQQCMLLAIKTPVSYQQA